MDKNTLLAMLTQQQPQQQFDPTMLLTSQQPVDMSMPVPQSAPSRSSQSVEVKTNTGFKPSYASQLDDEFYKQMQMRNDQVKQLQQDQADLKNQPTTFADVNLRPALAFADSLMGTNTAYSYQAPKGVENRKEQMQKLQDAIMKGQNAIGDDQLNYLKMKANEESLKLRENNANAQLNKQTLNREFDLRNEWSKDPITKNSKTIAEGWQKIQTSINGDSKASDLSLIYGLMKLQDPASTVRESEADMAQNIGGLPEKARAMFMALRGQGKLTPEQRQAIVGESTNLYQAQLQRQQLLDEEYKRMADGYGLNKSNVVLDGILKAPKDKSPTKPTASLNFDNMSDEELKKYLGQ